MGSGCDYILCFWVILLLQSLKHDIYMIGYVFVFTSDLECIFTVICNLVKKPDSLDEALEMAKLISTKISQQPNDKPAIRLKM